MDSDLELKLLRRLAAEYRQRALAEPGMARTLLEMADEMDARAEGLEQG